MGSKVRVLFVCRGNICRSPLAMGVFRSVVAAAGLAHRFEIDSAGTSSYHTGLPPDARTVAVALRRGLMLAHAARQVRAEDLHCFDYVVVMDGSNRDGVELLAQSGPGSARSARSARILMLREFDPAADGVADVPDPYFGGPADFEAVHDMVERACAGLLEHIRREHGL
jgi:protein-tyrosine phosphatase